MNVHLRIHYGCDKRINLVRDTIRVCYPYFTTIRILVSSTQKDVDELNELTTITSKLKINKFPIPFYGDYEIITRNLLNDIPEDDWVHVLDSDERPTYDCLSHMDSIINNAVNNNVNIIRFPSFQHSLIKPVNINEYNYVCSGHALYCEPSLFKYNKRKILLYSSYGGGHTQQTRTDAKEEIHYKPTLHLKNNDNWNQSLFLIGYFNPYIHSPKKEVETLISSRELAEFNALKEKTNCFTSTAFMDSIINNPEIKELFKNFALTLQDTKYPMFKGLYDWVVTDGFVPKINEIKSYCGNVCCKYNTIQL